MNTSTPEWFLATWARTAAPGEAALEGHAVRTGAPAAFAAVDSGGRPHLLIEVGPGDAVPTMPELRALRVAIEQLAVGATPASLYLDLHCTHVAHDATFASVAAEVSRALEADGLDPVTAVVRTIERWRAFWSIDPSGMTATDALGLFGELWFLDRWMAPLTRSVVESWHGPDKARHDVQWPRFSVEVKASAAQSVGGLGHRITSLEQLADPAQGELLLFSLGVVDDALAGNTLPGLVERIRGTMLGDVRGMQMLDEKLGAYGYTPAHASRYVRTLRIISETLYRVSGDFPRLTGGSFPGGIPTGVTHVSYSLGMAACGEHVIATSARDASWATIRATL